MARLCEGIKVRCSEALSSPQISLPPPPPKSKHSLWNNEDMSCFWDTLVSSHFFVGPAPHWWLTCTFKSSLDHLSHHHHHHHLPPPPNGGEDTRQLYTSMMTTIAFVSHSPSRGDRQGCKIHPWPTHCLCASTFQNLGLQWGGEQTLRRLGLGHGPAMISNYCTTVTLEEIQWAFSGSLL